jgi:hypothetical protein
MHIKRPRLLLQALKPLFGPTLLLVYAYALGGCVNESHADVKGSWAASASRDQTFSRVLIVGVSPNYDRRCEFEYALASQINGGATQALVSCNAMGKDMQLTRENIERVVASLNADAVLATSLIAIKMGTGETGSMDTRGGGYYKATDYGYGYSYGYAGGFGGYGMPVAVTYAEFQVAPSLDSLGGKIHLVSKFFETKNAELVYTVDIEASSKDIQSTSSALMGISEPIAERLRRDRLIHAD